MQTPNSLNNFTPRLIHSFSLSFSTIAIGLIVVISLSFNSLSIDKTDAATNQIGSEISSSFQTQPATAADLLFANSDGVYVANADGTNLTQVASLEENERVDLISYSPDGTKIAYIVSRRLYIIDLNDGAANLVPDVEVYSFQWSSDSSKLALGTNNAGALLEVASRSIENMEDIETTRSEYLIWSPNLERVAYDSAEGFTILNLETGEVELQLLGAYGVAWSPNGAYMLLLYITDSSNITDWYGDLHTWNVENHELTQLTFNASYGTSTYAIEYYPLWSPDSTQIATTTNRGGDYNVWVMNVDGSNFRQLTSNGWKDIDPSWLPDGEQISFHSQFWGNNSSSAEGGVFIINTNGGGKRQLTFEPHEGNPILWSPTSQQFMAIASEGLAVYNKDGTQTSLFEGDPFNFIYQWKPATGISEDETTSLANDSTCLISSSNNVNKRSEPSTSSNSPGKLNAGDSLAAIGQTEDANGFTWWYLTDSTWVRSDVVDETGNCDELEIVTPT